MNCCGGKRAALSASRSVPRPAAHVEPLDPPIARARASRMFVYVGESSLTVRGAVSGMAYRFVQNGARIEVAADDAFAMMAERDVRPASAG